LASSILYGSLCCSSFYVAWSRIRSVWVSMLCEFQYRLVSHPFCMGLYVVRVSMLLGLTSVLFGSLMLSEFLCYLVSLPFCLGLLCCPSFYFTCSLYRFCMGLYSVRFSMSLDITSVCIGLYVVRVSMSLGLTPVLYGSLCCPSFYVTWSHFRYVWFSMFSKFLCYLISLPFCMDLYFVRFSMSLNFNSVLYVLLCFPSF
jgi:hypothetical protein